MIKKQRIIAGFSLVLFFFTLSISFIPTKAAAKSDTLTATSQKYFKLQAFQRCIDGGSLNTPNLNLPPAGGSTPAKLTINGFAGLSGLIPKSIGTPFGDMDDSPIDELFGDDFYWWPSEMGVSVGYSVAKDDGKWICSISGHADEWFSLIGFKDFKDFREKYYKSYDDNLLTLKESRNKVVAELKNKINAAMPKLTNANLYQNFVLSFNKCAEQKSNKDEVIGTPIEVSGFVDIGGKQTDGTAYFQETEADQISVGHGVGASDGRFTCRTIATKLTALANDYFQYMKANPDEASDLASTTNTSTTDNSCEGQGGVLSWLLCPVLNMAGSALNWVDTQLSRLLEVDRSKFTSDGMYSAWSRFRDIGLTLLIGAMLVMVIGTALGIDALDAYTVKKAFPRLMVAIIFVLLSWYICSFLIELSNVIGKGTLGLLTSPFDGKAKSLTSLFEPNAVGAGVQIGGLALGAGILWSAPATIPILLSWIFSGVLVMVIAFLILIARQMFIVVLILGSPIAIISWIFPGNDKLWKLWWQSFNKLLLMYPMIMALVASGRIFAGVIATTNDSGAEGLLNTLLKLTAYILPYAFIPFVFKAAGGVFGNLAGMANDRSKGMFDRLRKGRQKGFEDIAHKSHTGDLARPRTIGGREFGGRFAKGLNRAASGASAGYKGRFGFGDRGEVAEDTHLMTAADGMSKSAAFVAQKDNDHILRAAAVGRTRNESIANMQRIFGYSLDDATKHVNQAEASIGLGRAQQVAAAKQLVMTNTGYDNVEQLSKTLAVAAGHSENTRNQLAGFSNAFTKQVGRSELAPGFGQLASLVKKEQDGTAGEADYVDAYDSALDSQGMGAMIGGKASAVRNLLGIDSKGNKVRTGAFQKRILDSAGALTAARATNDPIAIAAAERKHKQVLASTAASIDLAGNLSPEVATMMANELQSLQITGMSDANGNTLTVNESFEQLRGDKEWMEMRREYGNQQGAAIAQAQAQQNNPGAPLGGTPMGGAGGPLGG